MAGAPSEHEHRRRQHHRSEDDHLRRPRYESRQSNAEQRAEHGDAAEHGGDTDVDVTRAPMAHRAERAGGGDHGEAHGNRLLGAEAEHVNEDRHREDGPAAAQQAERCANQHARDDGCGKHLCHPIPLGAAAQHAVPVEARQQCTP